MPGSIRNGVLFSMAVLVLVLSACATSPGSQGPATRQTEDSVIYENLVYATRETGDLHLDMSLPKEGSGPYPALIFLHGGGFMEGGRGSHRADLLFAARRGYVGVLAEYRLTRPASDPPPHNRFPAAVHDVKAAIRWVRGHAEEYDIDPDRIGVCGFSAGGNLALMAAFTGPKDGLEGEELRYEVSSEVQAAVAVGPPVDFTDPIFELRGYNQRAIPRYLGDRRTHRDAYREASPINWLDNTDPPVLAIFGGQDALMGIRQPATLAYTMQQARADHMVLFASKGSHSWFQLASPAHDFPLWSFLDRHLK